MANGVLSIDLKKDWPLANPWYWLAGGAALTLWSWLWTLTFQANSSDNRVIVLALGLLVGGIGLWMRWTERGSSQLLAICPAPFARLARLGMGLFYLAAAVGVTAALVLAFYDWRIVGLRPGVGTMLWLTVAPLTFSAARRTIDVRADRTAISGEEETGLAFLVAGLAVGLGTLTLDLGPAHATEWDTMRVALRVLTTVTLAAGALVVVSPQVRRLVLSLVILLHFCAIGAACLASPPVPAVVSVIWARIFRPYLEFMYVNNAYHFYAPDPGPQSYLWYRVIYTKPNGDEVGMWHKTPHVDADNRPMHTASLEYQRYLVMGERLIPVVPSPAPYLQDMDGSVRTDPMYYRRSQAAMGDKAVLVGERGVDKRYPRIPIPQNIPFIQQLTIPSDPVKRITASLVRHVAQRFAKDPSDKTLTFKSVKVYRVVHHIATPTLLSNGLPPTDPETYRPIFMGNYDADGELLPSDRDDPYLYWLLPIMRNRPSDPYSPIKDWARHHAGDPKWVRVCTSADPQNPRFDWVDPKEDERAKQ